MTRRVMVMDDDAVNLLLAREVVNTFRAIERETSRPRTPIAALTASATLHELNECLRWDMDAVMSKPFAFQALRETLPRWAIVSHSA